MTWALIATKHLELRKRRGLMITAALLTTGIVVLVLGLRLIFHLTDPASNGPAGSPSIFSGLSNLLAEFGFLVAAAVGAAAGTTDLTDGVFRGLVITGRSRLALYLARIPAGLAVILPVIAVAFTLLCLVTSYAGTPQPTSVSVNGVSIPPNFDQAELQGWIQQHPQQAANAFPSGPGSSSNPSSGSSAVPSGAAVSQPIAVLYAEYTGDEIAGSNPAVNEMVKIGLWIELEVAVGFLAGLGLGSLTGQRTLTVIVLIGLEIIVTPILAAHVIPYFIDGQRLVVGVALDQLRPAALGAPGLSGGGGSGGPGRALLEGPDEEAIRKHHAALDVPCGDVHEVNSLL
jgi:hypothetical protein